jgi:putative ABC transport system substrate-binding protein
VLVKDANNPLGLDERSEAITAAQRLGLQLQFIEMQSAENFDRAFTEIERTHVQALLVTTDPLLFVHRTRILAMVATMRLPAMYGLREFVDGGGLLSYGVSLRENFRVAASYVDRILKGARPGELPIEQPTKFELIINLKTAKALGLTIPHSVLARADESIQ